MCSMAFTLTLPRRGNHITEHSVKHSEMGSPILTWVGTDRLLLSLQYPVQGWCLRSSEQLGFMLGCSGRGLGSILNARGWSCSLLILSHLPLSLSLFSIPLLQWLPPMWTYLCQGLIWLGKARIHPCTGLPDYCNGVNMLYDMFTTTRRWYNWHSPS